MAPSHTTFSWRLYKTFTRTLHCVKTAYWQVKRNRAVICSLSLRCFHILSVVELYRQCVFKPLLQQWSILVLSHQLASCFRPLLSFLCFCSSSLRIPFHLFHLPTFPPHPFARSLPSLLSHLFLCHFHPCFSGESRARRQQGRGFVCLCVRIGSVCWYAAAEPREAQTAHSLRCHVLLLTADGSFLFPGIYLQAEVLIYVWKVHGGSDFCLPTCSLCWFRCHLRASHDLSKDWGHPSPRS